MNTLPHIDDYFTGQLPEEMKKDFENKISQDPVFAEEVAFYLSVQDTVLDDVRNERKEKFRSIYEQYKETQKPVKPSGIIYKLWPYIAAAAVVTAVIVGWVLFNSSSSPAELADNYAKENFQTLSVKMSTKQDSLEAGFKMYNEGKLKEALSQFESMAGRDASSSEAIKFAGIVALQSGDYNKALKYFEELENWQGLRVNYGKFYHALTLMKRGRPDDMKTAKQLLQEIDQKNLDGKTKARVWLGKF